jgi:hypothetical protein
MLRFGMCGSVEVPADFPIGPLYGAHGRKVGKIVSQMEASDLPELGTVSAARRLSVRCARINHGSLSRPSSRCANTWVRMKWQSQNEAAGSKGHLRWPESRDEPPVS